MTNREYAALVYEQLKQGDRVMKVTGVLDEINKLDERFRKALKFYYRDGMTYKQVGAKLGITATAARERTMKAIRLLKHPSRSRYMHKEKVVKITQIPQPTQNMQIAKAL